MTFKINRHELKWNSREIEVPWWLGLSQQVTTKPEPDDDPKSKYNLGHMLPSGWDLTSLDSSWSVGVHSRAL